LASAAGRNTSRFTPGASTLRPGATLYSSNRECVKPIRTSAAIAVTYPAVNRPDTTFFAEAAVRG
jgi:hypothetical protein